MRIISFIDQPEIIIKILQHLKEITFDPSYSQVI